MKTAELYPQLPFVSVGCYPPFPLTSQTPALSFKEKRHGGDLLQHCLGRTFEEGDYVFFVLSPQWLAQWRHRIQYQFVGWAGVLSQSPFSYQKAQMPFWWKSPEKQAHFLPPPLTLFRGKLPAAIWFHLKDCPASTGCSKCGWSCQWVGRRRGKDTHNQR